MLVNTISDPSFLNNNSTSYQQVQQASSSNATMDDNQMLQLLLQQQQQQNNGSGNVMNTTTNNNAMDFMRMQQQQGNMMQLQSVLGNNTNTNAGMLNTISSGSSLSNMMNNLQQQQQQSTANAAFRRMSGMSNAELNLTEELSPLQAREVTSAFLQQNKQPSLSDEPDLLALMAAGMMNQNLQAPSLNTSNPLLQQVGLVGVDSASLNNNPLPQNVPSNNNNNDSFAENGILGPWSAHAAGLLGGMMQNESKGDGNNDNAQEKSNNKKKNKDKPKRPLSAYNIFFKEERNRILDSLPKKSEEEMAQNNSETSLNSDSSKPKKRKRKRKGPAPHGKIGFESLAKLIGKRWQELDGESMKEYKSKAEADMQRYKREMASYKEKQAASQNNSASAGSSNNLMALMMSNQQSTMPSSQSGMNQSAMFAGQMNMHSMNNIDLEPKPIQQNSNNSVLSLQQQQQMLQQQIQMLQQQQQAQQQQQQNSNNGLWGLMTHTNNNSNNNFDESPMKKQRTMDANNDLLFGNGLNADI